MDNKKEKCNLKLFKFFDWFNNKLVIITDKINNNIKKIENKFNLNYENFKKKYSHKKESKNKNKVIDIDNINNSCDEIIYDRDNDILIKNLSKIVHNHRYNKDLNDTINMNSIITNQPKKTVRFVEEKPIIINLHEDEHNIKINIDSVSNCCSTINDIINNNSNKINYDSIIDLNNDDEINSCELNNNEINNDEINSDEINNDEINNDENNSDENNNDEINSDEINSDDNNNDSINEDWAWDYL